MDFDKSKAYSTINADEVKVGSKGYFADSLDMLENYVLTDCKLSILTNIYESDNVNRFVNSNNMNFALFYLVEEPKEETYRPYENTDELKEDFKERFNINVPSYAEPLIWVKAKERTAKSLIYVFYPRSVYVGDEEEMPLDKLFEYYTYLDASPCGKKI